MKKSRQISIPVVVFLLLFSAIAYGITWTANKRLTNNAGWSVEPAIAVDGSKIYVVWQDDTYKGDQIYFKKSGDAGVTWTTNKRFTNNPGGSYAPAIAVNGSNIYVVWVEWNTLGSYDEIYFKKSHDNGSTWSANMNISNNPGTRSHSPAIAVDGSNIYVVWQDKTPPEGYAIYFKKSDDGGATWTTNKRLTQNVWGDLS